MHLNQASKVVLSLVLVAVRTYAQSTPVEKWCSQRGVVTPYFIRETPQWTVQFPDLIPADFNGDRLTDVLVYQAGTGLFAKWYSSDPGTCWPGFLYRDVRYTLPGAQIFIGDFNGDGLADVLLYRPDDGLFAKWYAHPNLEAVYSPDFIYQDWRVTIPHGQIYLGDFNGDGLTDVLIYRPSDGLFAKWYSDPGMSSDFQYQQVRYTFPNAQIVTGDFNGDQIIDVLIYQPHFNGQDGLFQKWYSTTAIGPDFRYMDTRLTIANGHVVMGDFNGDGLSDVFIYRTSDGLFAKWYSWNYGPDFLYQPVRYDAGLNRAFIDVRTGDFDGDGRTDLLIASDVFMYGVGRTSYRKWYAQAGVGPDFNRQFDVGTCCHYDLVTGDFNGDGATDVLARNWWRY